MQILCQLLDLLVQHEILVELQAAFAILVPPLQYGLRRFKVGRYFEFLQQVVQFVNSELAILVPVKFVEDRK